MARHFAAEGARLAICSRKFSSVDKVGRSLRLDESRLLVMQVDISTAKGMAKFVRAAYRKFHRIDVFINNAGVWKFESIERTSDAELNEQLAVNFSAVFYSLRELIPRMRKHGGGEIINVSSGAGRIPVPQLSVYCAAKAAVNMLTAVALREVRNDNIKITVLAPGPVDSGLTKKLKGRKHVVTVDQVADAAISIATQDQSAYSWIVEVRPLMTDTPFV
jgi:3-oxoacyl-[acyl-carrier protein] reductase